MTRPQPHPTPPLLAAAVLGVSLLLLAPSFAVAQDAAPEAAVADATAFAAPTGDAAAGEAVFGRQCVACHVVQDEAGEVLAGRSARTGPNLYGVVGRLPGTYPDYDYSDDMVAYGATGVVWEEANFVPYVQDPTGFLREALADPSARGKMSYKVRDEQDAIDVYAYLATFSQAASPAEAAPASE